MRIGMVDRSSCVIQNDYGDRIPWSLSGFDKTRFSEVEEPFREINDYLATLSPTARRNIWECYTKAREVFDRYRQVMLYGYETDNYSSRSSISLINEVTEIVTT